METTAPHPYPQQAPWRTGAPLVRPHGTPFLIRLQALLGQAGPPCTFRLRPQVGLEAICKIKATGIRLQTGSWQIALPLGETLCFKGQTAKGLGVQPLVAWSQILTVRGPVATAPVLPEWPVRSSLGRGRKEALGEAKRLSSPTPFRKTEKENNCPFA